MDKCQVKDIIIGEGKPKVCVPIVGKTDDEILQQTQQLKDLVFDMIEVRIDFYQNIHDLNKVIHILKKIRQLIKQPILLTYRSLKEGGEIQLNDDEYVQLITAVCQSGYIDLVDIEFMSGNVLVYQMIDIAHSHNIKVVLSNHDFDKTPSVIDMKERFEKMEILGGDVLKLAVMPQSFQDVIDLIHVTMEMSQILTKPLITMSMGKLGKLTRICGELIGSSVTFAAVGQSSAPGQIALENMQLLLEALHD